MYDAMYVMLFLFVVCSFSTCFSSSYEMLAAHQPICHQQHKYITFSLGTREKKPSDGKWKHEQRHGYKNDKYVKKNDTSHTHSLSQTHTQTIFFNERKTTKMMKKLKRFTVAKERNKQQKYRIFLMFYEPEKSEKRNIYTIWWNETKKICFETFFNVSQNPM